jgi:hypothetical protein
MGIRPKKKVLGNIMWEASTNSLVRSRVRIWAAGFAMAALVGLSGCQVVDEGVTDYRKATIDENSGDGNSTSVFKKYTPSDRGSGIPTDPNKKGNAAEIPVGKTFYVSLLQAFIGKDGGFHGWGNPFQRDEVAVILRVHDSNNTTERNEKLVFYSDDVTFGQFLNFSNLVTFGPTTYQGGVVTIDVDEVRLIRGTENLRKKLESLAADDDRDYVGPDPTQRHNFARQERDLIDLWERDGNGTRYTLTLLPAGGVADLPYPRFESGNYVVVRFDNRNTGFDWKSVKLDNNTGRLVYDNKASSNDLCNGDKSSGTAGAEFRCTSYVTVQINALDATTTVKPRTRPELDGPTEPRPVAPPVYKPLERRKHVKSTNADSQQH